MSPAVRLLISLFTFAAAALPAGAGTIPNVAKVYAITVKGDCFSITPSTIPGGKPAVKYLRSFQQAGRMQITPRVVTAGTKNGSNFRDAAFLVDHGTAGGGGVGAIQYVTNQSLFKFINSVTYPPADYAYVVSNAAGTGLTITHDKTQTSTSNGFKIDDTMLALPYTVKAAVISVTFLANGRVSGKIQLNGAGLLGSGAGSIAATFSGKVTTGSVGQ